MSIQVDQEQARLFLQTLGKNGDTRMRGFYPTGHPLKPSDPGKKAPLSLDTAAQWQQQGRGVYIVINDGGDTDASITACRALFCEWDDRPIEWQVTAWQELNLPEPSLIVLTGGKSAHCYWLFESPISVEVWRELQMRLLEYADADRTLKNPSRVMRLPGAWHLGPDGTPNGQSTIIHLSEQRYSPDADLTGDGVAGDRTLEGNEEQMQTFDQVIRIDQLRHANRRRAGLHVHGPQLVHVALLQGL